MTAQAIKIQTINYQPVGAGFPPKAGPPPEDTPAQNRGHNFKAIDKLSDLSKLNAQKASFEASLSRVIENKKYWDELLEKLRKSGGGGSGDKGFDRIAVSMMLTNFLRNKIIEAMIRNLNTEFGNIFKQIDIKISINIHSMFANVQKIGNVILKGFMNIISLIVRKDVAMQRLYTVSQWISPFAILLSFHLNKLKEILKLDIKGKMKKIMKGFVYKVIEMFQSTVFKLEYLTKKTFFLLSTQAPHESHNKKS